MATTQAKVNPKKKSSGFQGVKNAFFIILVCFVLAVLFFKYILGAPEHFVNGDPTQPVKDGNLMGTVYKGGVVVPVIITLLFSVSLSLSSASSLSVQLSVRALLLSSFRKLRLLLRQMISTRLASFATSSRGL